MDEQNPGAHEPMVKKAAEVGRPDGWRDPLFDVIHGDAERTGVTVLRGYIGGNTGTTNIRLYSSLEFNDYVDIPVECVVTIVDLRSASDTLAGQAVWVRLDAEMTHGSTGRRRQPLKELLSGDISGMRGGAGGGTRAGGYITPAPWCGGYMTRWPC